MSGCGLNFQVALIVLLVALASSLDGFGGGGFATGVGVEWWVWWFWCGGRGGGVVSGVATGSSVGVGGCFGLWCWWLVVGGSGVGGGVATGVGVGVVGWVLVVVLPEVLLLALVFLGVVEVLW